MAKNSSIKFHVFLTFATFSQISKMPSFKILLTRQTLSIKFYQIEFYLFFHLLKVFIDFRNTFDEKFTISNFAFFSTSEHFLLSSKHLRLKFYKIEFQLSFHLLNIFTNSGNIFDFVFTNCTKNLRLKCHKIEFHRFFLPLQNFHLSPKHIFAISFLPSKKISHS